MNVQIIVKRSTPTQMQHGWSVDQVRSFMFTTGIARIWCLKQITRSI